MNKRGEKNKEGLKRDKMGRRKKVCNQSFAKSECPNLMHEKISKVKIIKRNFLWRRKVLDSINEIESKSFMKLFN